MTILKGVNDEEGEQYKIMILGLHNHLFSIFKFHTSPQVESMEKMNLIETDGVELPNVTVWDSPHSSFEASDVPFVQMDKQKQDCTQMNTYIVL